jgi:hypothetical protein
MLQDHRGMLEVLNTELSEECERVETRSTLNKFHHAGSFTTPGCGLDIVDM